MNPRVIESILHIETLKLGSKGSSDSVLTLMHVTYLVHLLRTYLTSTFLHVQASPPGYCSGLGSAPPATAHAQNVLHLETKSKVRPKKICPPRSLLHHSHPDPRGFSNRGGEFGDLTGLEPRHGERSFV